uniref:Uncharacterized protein n=1 Tax=Oryza sativa subsp. japonica TaxID=39947 RepID=Q6Z5U1_ORYSJ|nr:hypothetical protein [Oryza sativa Japonica Group]
MAVHHSARRSSVFGLPYPKNSRTCWAPLKQVFAVIDQGTDAEEEARLWMSWLWIPLLLGQGDIYGYKCGFDEEDYPVIDYVLVIHAAKSTTAR